MCQRIVPPTIAGPRRQVVIGSATDAGFALEPRLMPSVDVLTYHNDNQRTGADLAETTLNPVDVNAASFGKVGQVAVDGAVYGQPLVKTGVTIPGQGVHDVVYVATEHDSVYAFDADTLAPIWHDSFINPALGVTPVPMADTKASDINPEIGITSTPVIDPVGGTIYVVATTKSAGPNGVSYDQTLHALDLATGAEKLGGPVDLAATVRGGGKGSVRGQIRYQALIQNQRPALLLANGVIYIASASFGDNGPYHGWVLGYDAQTLKPVAAFNATPGGAEGGIWMSGGGIAADPSGFLYLSTGNGTFRPGGPRGNYGGAVVKLSPDLKVVDYYAPKNQRQLSAKDLDLGSGGMLLVPDRPGSTTPLIVTGGKDGTMYLLDRDRLGHYSPRTDRAVQVIPEAVSAVFGTPAYFNGRVYYAGMHMRNGITIAGVDALRAFTLVNGKITGPPVTGTFSYGYPGSTPSVSADGASGGIVWTLDNGGSPLSRAVLRATDATDVSHELYDSTQAGARDAGGPAVKFAVPTVADGRVYVGGTGTLTVYGLLPPSGPKASPGH